MTQIGLIGLDVAKHVFQLHAIAADGRVVFRRQVRRAQLMKLLASIPSCRVAMEACGTAHYWGRQLEELGHQVLLIPPDYVRPFVKRQKNDAADAEAIAEAAQRPDMRFVRVKSEASQASSIVFRARDLVVRQRTQLLNAIRSHLAEFGLIFPQGAAAAAQMQDAIDSHDDLPPAARCILMSLWQHLSSCEAQLAEFDKEIQKRSRDDLEARRLTSVPGIGPVTAAAIAALAPEPSTFRKGRDFAAWVGLTPLERSTGGKQRFGRISKMGERTLRRLLIMGASAVVSWVRRGKIKPSSWLASILHRKPPMLAIVALANKMARVAWAILKHGGSYMQPV
ncbi:IS110 family transposase (plasmid) [Ensifer adhaerens]|uniref:IS110 family transposase n=1 Tax=Ensifer adhaerens TaxID=106592 RepID=UPI003CF2E07B